MTATIRDGRISFKELIMPIIRVEKTEDYTCMKNYHLRDKNLSLRAKGLMSVILSLPDTWKFSIAGLASICGETERCIKTALKELETEGFATITKLYPNQTKSGRIEYVYTFYERPLKFGTQEQDATIQGVEKQPLVAQEVENSGQLSTYGVSTDISSTDVYLNGSNTYEKDISIYGVSKKESVSNARKSFNDIIDDFTQSQELRESLRGFVQYKLASCKSRGTAFTNRALELSLRSLSEMSSDPHEMAAIADAAVEHGWLGFYQSDEKKTHKPRNTEYDTV